MEHTKRLNNIIADISIDKIHSSVSAIRKAYRELTKKKKQKVYNSIELSWRHGKIMFNKTYNVNVPFTVSNRNALNKLTTETMGYVGKMHTGVANGIIKDVEKGIKEGLSTAQTRKLVEKRIAEIAKGDKIAIRTTTGKTMKWKVKTYADLLATHTTNIAYDRGHAEAAKESGIVSKTKKPSLT